MEKAIEKFLNDLCIDWGFCISAESKNKLISSKHLVADEFACSILEAEGMDPELEIEWRRKIRNKFIETFGNEFDNSL